ncbi:MAG: SPFH/Band 7/PHB domain protein [Lachnospiraceae bacterium]|nr:SPFH/Band 7/PHB domain protein [Lachnospiraceae bacterium]
MGPFITIVIVLLLLLVFANIKIVPQTQSYIIERLGKYQATWYAGIHLKIPFIDKVIKHVSLKEQIADFPPQPVITKDNVTMQIDSVVFFKVFDSRLFAYGVENPILALENLTSTTLRNIIGELELDETLTSREIINTKMQTVLDEATDPWGIKVGRVEVKNITPPPVIRESMEKQMKAERERREQILIAEGEKKAAILKAEGEKESAILRADAQKIEMVREAEGHAESIRLHKEAEAEGILRIKQAEADGIKMLLESGMSQDQIVRLRSLETLTAAADGQATKIIIPSDIQGAAGLVAAVKEISQ